MFRLHLDADDLARTRLVTSYGPYAEALFSLGLVRHRRRAGVLFGGWWRRLATQTPAAGDWAGVLSRLIGDPPGLDLFTLIGQVSSVQEGVQAMLGIGRRQLRAEVAAAASCPLFGVSAPGSTFPAWAFRLPDDRGVRSAFAVRMRACCTTAVYPYWDRIQAHLEAETAANARRLALGGIAALANSLHVELRWHDGTLLVQDGMTDTADLYLDGRGLALVPSVFCRRITLYISVAAPDAPAVLFYPALRDVTDAYRLWAADRAYPTTRALAALLGGTRAAALDIIGQRCVTTTELARRLGVSAPTASHHATVLRDAGLITTRRLGGSVEHAITTLGAALLNGEPP
jgi:DNA-binding transcriptional ArsR family regulator